MQYRVYVTLDNGEWEHIASYSLLEIYRNGKWDDESICRLKNTVSRIQLAKNAKHHKRIFVTTKDSAKEPHSICGDVEHRNGYDIKWEEPIQATSSPDDIGVIGFLLMIPVVLFFSYVYLKGISIIFGGIYE